MIAPTIHLSRTNSHCPDSTESRCETITVIWSHSQTGNHSLELLRPLISCSPSVTENSALFRNISLSLPFIVHLHLLNLDKFLLCRLNESPRNRHVVLRKNLVFSEWSLTPSSSEEWPNSYILILYLGSDVWLHCWLAPYYHQLSHLRSDSQEEKFSLFGTK